MVRLLLALPILAVMPVAALHVQSGAARAQSALQIQITLPARPIGERAPLSAVLTDGGVPVGDVTLQFWLNDTPLRKVRADLSGLAEFTAPAFDEAGTYSIGVTFDGAPSRDLGPAEASGTLEVTPAPITLTTVPAMQGVVFELLAEGGTEPLATAASGPDGVANMAVSRLGTYTLRTVGEAEGFADGQPVRGSFIRWGDDVFQPERELVVDGRPLEFAVGLGVWYSVTHSFQDGRGNPVDLNRVESLFVTNTMGQRIEMEKGPMWLMGVRAVRGKFGLEPSEIQYSINSALIDGADVVTRSEQRFFPSIENNWVVSVKLFSLTLSAKDALLGRSIDRSVSLVYPNGRKEHYDLKKGEEIVIHDLPRGNYELEIDGALIASTVPISLSRDQVVEVEVVTLGNGVMVIGAGLAAAVGLALIGRRFPFRKSRAASQPSESSV